MEEKIFEKSDTKIPFPVRCLVAGASSSGKSTLVFRILRERRSLFNTEHEIDVIYCLPRGNSIEIPQFIKDDKKIRFNEGIVNFEEINGKATIVILDDCLSNLDESLINSFCRFSHHLSE